MRHRVDLKNQKKIALIAATLLVASTPAFAAEKTKKNRAAKSPPVVAAPAPVVAPAASVPVAAPTPVVASNGPEALYRDGKVSGEVRYRYEFIDQDGPAPITRDAKASTVRVNLGFKTGVYQGFQAGIEGQTVQHIGARLFNDSINGATSYPAVTDPDVTVLNELWLSNNSLPETVVKVGRQKINIDNQRFIGTVNWRQNDQTFDAVNVVNTTIPGLELMYGYLWNVNRIQGPDFATGRLNSDTHIAHAAYKAADWLTATAYGYWMDFDNSRTLSNQTYGLRLTGSTPICENMSFFYEAEGARQMDYGTNTTKYNAWYFHVVPGIKAHGATLKGGLEYLGGDGTMGFQTPLATLHIFNGWADKFLTTPTNGLLDYYGVASYQFSGIHRFVDGIEVVGAYHKYYGDKTGNFGSELNFAVTRGFKLPEGTPFKTIDVALKYANYDAKDAPYTDTQKVAVQFGVKF